MFIIGITLLSVQILGVLGEKLFESPKIINYEISDAKFQNCLNVVQENCQLCEQKYFLFSLPQDHDNLGLKKGTKICVQCPYFKYNEENNFYCGDCLDKSQTWDNYRTCTYDYKTKSTGASVFHKIDRPARQLFYVVMSGDNTFTTQSCDGCEHFCRFQNSTCLPVSQQFSYDLNNLYIKCAEGYEYSDLISGCDPCPENCNSCQIDKNITQDSDKTIINVKKNCLRCNDGFSLLRTRKTLNKDETEINSVCVACFVGCETCHFGLNGKNLNNIPWDAYNNNQLLLTNNFDTNETKFYEDLFKIYKVAQRCEYCTNTTQSTFIPSLNRTSCVKCGTNCRRCEYKSKIDDTSLPTRDIEKVIWPESENPTQEEIQKYEDEYILRCRECDKFNQTFNALGTGCTDCSIANCKLCGIVSDSNGILFSTLAIDFLPLTQDTQTIEQCFLCDDDYYLSMDKKLCTQMEIKNEMGCLSYYIDKETQAKQCQQCSIGQTLYKNSNTNRWECKVGCQSDYLCQSCVEIGADTRCLRCLDGFYFDITKNKGKSVGQCKKCQENGYCKKCYVLSLLSIHHSEYYDFDYQAVQPNDLDEALLQESKRIHGPYCYECFSSESAASETQMKPILNEDLRLCEQGGSNCKEFQARGLKGYCNQCLQERVGVALSSSSDFSDCIECPDNTIGCRDRSPQEIIDSNKYFDSADDQKYEQYQRLSFKCQTDGNYYDANINRCIEGISKGDRYYEFNIEADCSQTETNSADKWNINAQFNNITLKDATIVLEDKLSLNDKNDLFTFGNKYAVTKISITLNFTVLSGDNQNKCFFPKDTYFTSNIRRKIFSVQELELKIVTSDNQQKIQWFIQRNLYFVYFTSVSINGIELHPAYDIDQYKISTHIPKYESPFGIIFLNNTGSKFSLKNVKIGNECAENHFQNNDNQTKTAAICKKQMSFFTSLLNIYEITLKDVTFQCQNYLSCSDNTFQGKPFGFTYDPDILLPYLKIQLENISFSNISVENQAIFDIQSINFKSVPEWTNKIWIKNVKFEDCYFINDGAFLSTNVFNKPTGIVIIDTLIMRNIEYNNSRGIVDFTTMQQIKVSNFQMYNSKINYTALFHVTTLEISDVYLQNVSFTYKGRLIQTQYEINTIRVGDPEFSGLKLKFINLRFDQVICLTPACLILLSDIQNAYDISLNITIKGLIIKQINSIGFDKTIWGAATSAAIRVEKSNTLVVTNFESIENYDLAVFYVEQVWVTKFVNINCHQNQGQINPNSHQKSNNNYCLFINNPYKWVELLNVELRNLIAYDNSFVGISSWSNLIYNTSTSDYLETIIINGVKVTQCEIITTVLAVPSSAILIDSTQMQIVKIDFMYFYNNKHTMEIDGSLRPSNPTLLMRSVVGTLYLENSIWRSNSVEGFGAVLYLEVGAQVIKNITMENSNFDKLTEKQFPSINEITDGGHIYLSAFNLSMINCTFSNSTAKQGGAIFMRTLKEGIFELRNISVQYAYTPLYGTIKSRGGCLFIDSMASKLDMNIMNVDLNECYTRGEGGGIFLMSYDKEQKLTIEETTITNCYALSGLAIKTLFYSRSKEIQRMILRFVNIKGNQQNSLDYFKQLDSLQQIEMFLFIKRIAAIEQDFGQIDIQNSKSDGLFYYGFISIWQANLIRFNSIESYSSVLSYRPFIEILEPLENEIDINIIQFRNISSISIQNLNCTVITNNGLCRILLIRLQFGDFKINPALILIDQIYEQTKLKLRSVTIQKVICKECFNGLVQIMRVSNSNLVPLVEIDSCKCQKIETSFLGCFAISSKDQFSQQIEEDKKQYINQVSNLTAEKISILTELQIYQRRILEKRTLEEATNQLNQNTSDNTKLSSSSHVIVLQSNFEIINAVHGGGISYYGLTVNQTACSCYLTVVEGKGGCIYFESYPKYDGKIQHRLNIAENRFHSNQASIGGAIAIQESGINNYFKTSNTFVKNFAKLYGNDTAQYPTSLGVKLNGVLQKSSHQDSQNIKRSNFPIFTRSGQEMISFENQTVSIVFLDALNNILGYQENQECIISINANSSNQQKILKNDLTRKFTIENGLQGFNYSNQIINFNPYSENHLDVFFQSSYINIPIYDESYPFQCKEFETNFRLYVRIKTVECEYGEYYSEFLEACIPCGKDEYALLKKALQCKLLDSSIMDESYLNRIKLKEYFWRPNYFSDNIELCDNKLENCKGGFDVGNAICQTGLIGALCEECDFYAIQWESSYFKTELYECGSCNRAFNIFVIIFICFVMIVSTFLTAYFHEQRIIKEVITNYLKKVKLIYAASSLNRTSIYLKILFNSLQLFSLFGKLKINKNQNYFNFINSISMPAVSMGYFFDCILVNQVSDTDLIYLKLIFFLVCQFGSLIIILVIMFILRFRSLVGAAIFMFIYSQPSFLIEFTNLLISRSISGDNYIQANVSYLYDTDKHTKWLQFIYFAFFVLLFSPLLLVYQLMVGKYYDKFNKMSNLFSWGILYHEYSYEKNKLKSLYEIFRIYIRTFICICICLFAQDVVKLASSFTLLIFINLIANIKIQPYKEKQLNNLDQYQNFILMLTFILAGVCLLSSKSNNDQLSQAGTIVIIVLNVIYYCYLFSFIFSECVGNRFILLDHIRDKIQLKYPALVNKGWFTKWILQNRQKTRKRAIARWTELTKVVKQSIDEWRYDKNKPLKLTSILSKPLILPNEAQIL